MSDKKSNFTQYWVVIITYYRKYLLFTCMHWEKSDLIDDVELNFQ